ncbi:lysylphosphatidylglycerol synthase transmembrane domain-containing protein [Corynebacterium sp. AOP40-9SA-29]|uniref:lysylphosphatidylglycerol synthase transmembrane domain-containing protein n=1 Tax=Corynebacterium sp. AOP40-9SA-29 TaxID=3457677 RepID=UPI004033DA89
MTSDPQPSRFRDRWHMILQWLKDPRVRALLTLMLLGAIIFLARDHYHFLEEGWAAMLQANNWYILAAVAAMGLSMIAQAEVMVALLRPAGVPVKRTSANALGLSANAWSSSFPGGPAISAAMIFREQMKWGATPVIASWYLVISGVLSGAAMALLGFGAVFFLQANVHVFSLSFSLVALIALTLAANWVARNPEKVQSALLSAMTWFNEKRRKPADRFHSQIRSFADQLRAVDLSPKWLGYAVSVSLLNWVLEIVCLFLCILAIGAEPSVAGAVLAFIAAKLIGQAPITPGGLGPVDITLTTMLVSTAGLGSGQAVAAVIVFRMISFALLTLVGWLVFLWTFVRPEEEQDAAASAASDTGTTGASGTAGTVGGTSGASGVRRRSGRGLTFRQITGGSAARRAHEEEDGTGDGTDDGGTIDRLPRHPERPEE